MGKTFLKGVIEDFNCHCKYCHIDKIFHNEKQKNLWFKLHMKKSHSIDKPKEGFIINDFKNIYHNKN